MSIEIKEGKNKFYIGESEKDTKAEMTFVVSNEDFIIIDHTHVGDEFRGQGVGNLLLDRVVKWAKEDNKKIIPLCPFAKKQMEGNEKYRDMIY